MAKKVIIYGTLTCPNCYKAKDFFDSKNISYEYIDVMEDKEKAIEMVKKTKQMHVPVIEIDGKVIIGFNIDEINNLLDN